MKAGATYVSLAFAVPPGMADEAAGILVADGALGCEVSKIKSSSRSRGNPVLLRAYFERISPARVRRLHTKLRGAGMLANGTIPDPLTLVDPGWATMWQARFAPFHTGRRFLIAPPWQADGDPARITIIIRPGQAFGTGHHPSTSGTLSAVEELCGTNRITRALDVGTGSGILAIAMVKLGVAEVTAIDNDPRALENADENASLNRVATRIRFSTTPLSAIRGRFGLITANILSSTLIQMAPDLTARLRNHGSLVLAGILRREAQSVADAYAPDLVCIGWRNHRAWTTLIFQRSRS